MKWNWTKFCDKIEGNVRLRYTRHSGWIYNVIPIKGRDQENSFVFYRVLPESTNPTRKRNFSLDVFPPLVNSVLCEDVSVKNKTLGQTASPRSTINTLFVSRPPSHHSFEAKEYSQI